MIGVVIAVRDQAGYLGEALDSVFAQTVPVGQLVVVDDASVDGSGEIARARGVHTVEGPGRGPAIARNIGAALIETEFIAFLDGDDRFTPDRGERLLAGIEGRAVCSGAVREFYDPGREAELADTYTISPEPVAGGTPATMLLRRETFTSLGGFPEDETSHEFFDFVRRLGPIPQIDHVVLERRIHGANRSIVKRDEIRRQFARAARAAIIASREPRST